MKILINIVFLLYFSISYGQNKYSEIKYYFKINEGGNPIVLDCALLYDEEKHLSTFINFGFQSIPKERKAEQKNINGEVHINIEIFDDNNGQKPEYQKFFMDDLLLSHESVYGEKKYHIINEKLPELDWQILNETSDILGFKVQNAKLFFRGREYLAWFTTQIKISDGPYKFHGLPGLILKIESIDEKYTFEAYSIKLNISSDNFEISNLQEKYSDKNNISIDEKINLINKNTEKEKKFRLSNNPNTTDILIEHTGIELNYNDILNEK